ncbi:MAG: hypothetical protein IK062_08635 [Selenomonadaceae bacterium]|nr:hypothetical protein [Selenomonadaceae bacterium]
MKLYEEVKSVKKVIQKLGYPTREGLYKWLRDSKNPPPELKLETIRHCFECGEKVYLSPIVDCFDEFIPSWTIGTSPNATLVN